MNRGTRLRNKLNHDCMLCIYAPERSGCQTCSSFFSVVLRYKSHIEHGVSGRVLQPPGYEPVLARRPIVLPKRIYPIDLFYEERESLEA